MKIAYIANSIIPSRTANSIHVIKMCQALLASGHEVSLIVLTESGAANSSAEEVFKYYDVEGGFRLFRIKVRPVTNKVTYLISTFFSIFAVWQQLKRNNYNLVFGRYLPGCFIAAFSGGKVIFESHFPIWKGKLEQILFYFFVRCPGFKRLILITQSLKSAYLKKYRGKIQTDMIHVVADAADRVSNWNKWQGGASRPGILQTGYVGNLYKGKGVELIVELASIKPDVDFHIIGGMESDIVLWRTKVNSTNIFFHGFVTQSKLSEYINFLDVCLLPNQAVIATYGTSERKTNNISKYTSPLKMFEYMAHKKPIIASDMPVLKEVLNDKMALFAKHDDIYSWVRAIDKLKDKQLREKLGTRAQHEFLEKYTWKKRAEQVLQDLK